MSADKAREPATLSLGFSTCPNDTFIFHALAHDHLGGGVLGPQGPKVLLADVEELNRMALEGMVDVCKVSAAAWPELKKEYALLSSGGAMGRGVGPVLVVKKERPARKIATVAIPGEHTTAARLLRLYSARGKDAVAPHPIDPDGPRPAMRFDRIAPAIQQGAVDAGVLIHEGRFTYQSLGLELVRDLGEWWEREYELPLPLGCIVARRSLGEERIARIDAAIRESLEAAFAEPERPMEYVRGLAQELGEEAIRQHIETFVTPWSLDMGEEGRKALDILENA